MKVLSLQTFGLAILSLLFSTASPAAFQCMKAHSVFAKPASLKAFDEQAPVSPMAIDEARIAARNLFQKLEFGEISPRMFDANFIKQIRQLVKDARYASSEPSLSKYRLELLKELQNWLRHSPQFSFLNVDGLIAYSEFLIDPGVHRNAVLNEAHALYLILSWEGKIEDPKVQQVLSEVQTILEPLAR